MPEKKVLAGVINRMLFIAGYKTRVDPVGLLSPTGFPAAASAALLLLLLLLLLPMLLLLLLLLLTLLLMCVLYIHSDKRNADDFCGCLKSWTIETLKVSTACLPGPVQRCVLIFVWHNCVPEFLCKQSLFTLVLDAPNSPLYTFASIIDFVSKLQYSDQTLIHRSLIQQTSIGMTLIHITFDSPDFDSLDFDSPDFYSLNVD